MPNMDINNGMWLSIHHHIKDCKAFSHYIPPTHLTLGVIKTYFVSVCMFSAEEVYIQCSDVRNRASQIQIRIWIQVPRIQIQPKKPWICAVKGILFGHVSGNPRYWYQLIHHYPKVLTILNSLYRSAECVSMLRHLIWCAAIICDCPIHVMSGHLSVLFICLGWHMLLQG